MKHDGHSMVVVTRKSARGFTLVEVLVALVVLTVGMLGIAGLYVEGLRAGRISIYRTAAITLAADMADRIRANAAGGVTYAGTGPGADNGCVNGVADCIPAQMAADDWYRWMRDVQGRLPTGATARINTTNVPGTALTQFDIQLSWPEVGQTDPTTYTLAMQQ